MSFTTQPPTIPGAYRWRISADMPDVHLAEVSDADGMLVAQRGSNPARYCVELCGGEWEGPLVIAEEAQAIDHPKNLKRHRACASSSAATKESTSCPAGDAKPDRLAVALATAGKEMAEAARTPNASACGSPPRAFSCSANC